MPEMQYLQLISKSKCLVYNTLANLKAVSHLLYMVDIKGLIPIIERPYYLRLTEI